MPKYQNSGKYRNKQQYRSMKDIYRSLQDLYKRIERLQKYRTSGASTSGSYGYKPRVMPRYSSEHHPEKYTKEKIEPRYIVKTEAPKYKIETPRIQMSAEQLAEATERKIEAKLKPLIEGIEKKLDVQSADSIETVEPQEGKSKSFEELRTHELELREFQDPDWNGSREDLELLRNIKDALVRSIETHEPDSIQPGLVPQKIEMAPIGPEVHWTEPSSEFKISQQPELGFNEPDFLALESELFGIESEIEPPFEDRGERMVEPHGK